MGLLVGLAKQIGDFGRFGVGEPFAAAIERFVESHGCVLHSLVRRLGAADEEEMLDGRDPLMAIAVESDAEQPDHFAACSARFGFHRDALVGEVSANPRRIDRRP